jgi:hypothetical protein
MSKKYSATELGNKLGLTAQEVNCLLRDEGFLEGKPGNWKITEKGEQYSEKYSWSNGYGGWCARGYSMPLWDSNIMHEIQITNEKKQEIKRKVKEERIARKALNAAQSLMNSQNTINQEQGTTKDNDSSNFINEILGFVFELFAK